MQLERSKNAKRNICFGLINSFVTLFYPFIIRTFVIKNIGAEFLGLTGLFTSILSVLSLTELGFSSAIVFSMYKPIAEDDEETVCALLAFYRKVYFIIGIVMLSLGLIVLPFIPILIKGSVPENVNIYILFMLYLVNSVISYIFFGYKSAIIQAYQRCDIASKITTSVFVFSYTCQFIVILFTKNYYLYVCCVIIASLLINICTEIVTRKMFPTLVCKGTLSIDIKKDLKEKISGLMVEKLNGVTRNSLDSMFLVFFLGLVETAKYNNYYYIMTSVIGLSGLINSSITAGIGNSVVLHTQQENYEEQCKLNFIYMWVSGFCSICMLCLYQPFTALFWGEEMLFPMSTVILFCVYFYVLKTGDIIAIYCDTNGLWWKKRYYVYAETVSNVVLNYLLGKFFGVNGIIAGTLISMVFITNTLSKSVVYHYYFTEYKFRSYLLMHLRYLVVTIGVALIVYSICSCIKQVSIMGMAARLIICILCSNLFYFIIYHKTSIYRKSILWFIDIFKLNNTCVGKVLEVA